MASEVEQLPDQALMTKTGIEEFSG